MYLLQLIAGKHLRYSSFLHLHPWAIVLELINYVFQMILDI